MKKRLVGFLYFLSFVFIQIIPFQVWAGGEGLDVPEAMEKKVPLEGLSGIKLFFAQLYNDNLILFAVVCTLLMMVVGMIIAYATDIVLKAVGLEVGKIEHKE
jgi:hypothetical protein